LNQRVTLEVVAICRTFPYRQFSATSRRGNGHQAASDTARGCHPI
jgi:hypothetical protein